MGIAFDLDIKTGTDWRTFISKMGDVAAQGLLSALGGDGISGGISSLFDALGAWGKIEATPGRCGWELFSLSFAWAFDSLRQDLCDPDTARQAARHALETARDRVQQDRYEITGDFLACPASLPLYREIRDAFVDARAAFRPQGHESADSLKIRFDSAFNRAVHAVWSKDPARFTLLAQALDTPAAAASDFERHWHSYRQQLIYDFTVKPVFGQEQTRVSLSQLYVPLRGTWRDRTERGERHPAPDRQEKRHLVRLDHMLDAWAKTAPQKDWLRLIGGGPGSGKSTTLKAFAARLAADPTLRPIYIPLQHMDLDRPLRDAVNHWLTQTVECPFRQPPLDKLAVENGPRLVLIFDGLDELSRPGDGASQVVNLFTTRLGTLRAELGGHMLALVASRTLGFQEAIKALAAAPEQAFEVVGFCPVDDEDDIVGDDSDRQHDQRPDWWGHYAALAGLPPSIPEAMTHDALAALTDEPLLCYLLALSGYVTKNWQEAAENHNRIYDRLIGEVWRRGWGDGGRLGPGRGLERGDFQRLMETIALAAWHGGDTRTANEYRFGEACNILQTGDVWETFTDTNGPDMGNLALNFYLKASDADKRGFEFTHKSFGDYLTARALFFIATELAPDAKKKKIYAAAEWLRAIGNGTLTREILDFIRAEAVLAGIDTCKNVQSAFEILVSHAIQDGFPAHNVAKTWREAEKRQNSAECFSWAVMNAASRVTTEISIPTLMNRYSIKSILSRSNDNNFYVRDCLSFSKIHGQTILCDNLSGSDISHVDLSKCAMYSVAFHNSNINKSIIRDCFFYDCTFQSTQMRNTDIFNGGIQKCRFIDCKLSMVSIEGTLIDLDFAKEIGAPTSSYDQHDLVTLPPGYLNTDEEGRIRFTPK